MLVRFRQKLSEVVLSSTTSTSTSTSTGSTSAGGASIPVSDVLSKK
jgi:hypothetical protein